MQILEKIEERREDILKLENLLGLISESLNAIINSNRLGQVTDDRLTHVTLIQELATDYCQSIHNSLDELTLENSKDWKIFSKLQLLHPDDKDIILSQILQLLKETQYN